jgi:hypothetical protein
MAKRKTKTKEFNPKTMCVLCLKPITARQKFIVILKSDPPIVMEEIRAHIRCHKKTWA